MMRPISAVSAHISEIDLGSATECEEADAFVRAHPQSTPFHLTGWSRAVERGTKARAHYLVARGAGGILGILPCHVMRSPFFGNALVSAGFGVQGGILGDVPSLADHALFLAQRRNCPTVELRGGALPEDWAHDDSSYVRFIRELESNDDEELKAIPRKRRAEIRRALSWGLEVRIGTAPRDRAMHYRVYAESVRNLGTPVFPSRLFDCVLRDFGNDADILTVMRAGKPLASVLSLYHNGVVMPFWGGGTAEACAAHANEFLYYALMCHARSTRGCRQFDFGRSKTGSGAAAFKKNFGFSPVPLCYARHTLDGGSARDINPQNPRYRLSQEIWRRLPLPIANALGPHIAKGLG